MRNKLKVYSSRKIQLTPQEKVEYNKRLDEQIEKYKRDSKCGGIDPHGNFTRLHDRSW